MTSKLKRGPRAPKWGCTLAEIAAMENCSVASVERTLNSAVSKLQQVPGAFAAIVNTIHAMDASHFDPLVATSAECRKTWIEQYYTGRIAAERKAAK